MHSTVGFYTKRSGNQGHGYSLHMLQTVIQTSSSTFCIVTTPDTWHTLKLRQDLVTLALTVAWKTQAHYLTCPRPQLCRRAPHLCCPTPHRISSATHQQGPLISQLRQPNPHCRILS